MRISFQYKDSEGYGGRIYPDLRDKQRIKTLAAETFLATVWIGYYSSLERAQKRAEELRTDLGWTGTLQVIKNKKGTPIGVNLYRKPKAGLRSDS